MKAGELKKILEHLPDDKELVFQIRKWGIDGTKLAECVDEDFDNLDKVIMEMDSYFGRFFADDFCIYFSPVHP